MAPHPQRLTVTHRAWPLARPTATARGVKTTVDVVVAEISDVESRGRGEAVPLQRFGESIDSVAATLEAMKGAIASGLNRDTLQSALPPGAARNALDCAFWDMDAKRAYCSVAELAGGAWLMLEQRPASWSASPSRASFAPISNGLSRQSICRKQT